MELRNIGKTDIKACPVALGTWAMGGGAHWNKSDVSDPEREAVATIHAALDNGINLIDSAPTYGFGLSEEIIGKALKGKRRKAIIATKCGLWWEDDTGAFFFSRDGKTLRRSLAPKTIRQEVELSLERLHTDYIDLYQTHWQADPAAPTPIAETMECLLDLKKQGKIRAIGVSNVTVNHLNEYSAAGGIETAQPRFSMLDRTIEKDILPFCVKNGISILAYSPLEQGLLTGAITMEQTFGETEYRNKIPWFLPLNRKKVLDMLAGWKVLTNKYGCTLSQLVIAWTIDQPGITFALCGGRKVRHIEENAKAAELKVEPGDLDRMRKEVIALGEPTV